MRRWGIVITIFYAIILALLLIPAGALLFKDPSVSDLLKPNGIRNLLGMYNNWLIWIWIGIPVAGQALLLFLSVDTSWRRIKPRQHLVVTATLAAFFAAILTFSAVWSLAVGVFGDKALGWYMEDKNELLAWGQVLGWLVGLWGAWGVVFSLYCRNAPTAVTAVVSWLLRGGVLELLIAVPAHILVRHRNDCSAPGVTGFGIVTGIAIMLLCFGPSVLALYKKKLDAYSRKREQTT